MSLSRCVQREFFNLATAVVLNPLQHDALGVCQACHSSRAFESGAYRRFAFQFVDAGYVYIATDSDLRSNRRKVNYIAGKQPDIVGFVALLHQIVDIEFGQRLAPAP